MKKPNEQNESKVFVANGEIGYVVEVHPNYSVAKMENPDRLIRIPHGNEKQYDNENSENENDESGATWTLAYGITTHKSQGSEFSVVIVMIDSYPGAIRLCTKEHIYTSLSRGKNIVITIGRKAIVNQMIQKSGLWLRKTFLRETLDELRNAGLEREWELLLMEG